MSARRKIAAAPGAANTRFDDLHELVRAVMRMPRSYGVHQQQLELSRVARETWERTLASGINVPWLERAPCLDKGFECYHRPEPLRLDALVRMLAARSSADGGIAPGDIALELAERGREEERGNQSGAATIVLR